MIVKIQYEKIAVKFIKKNLLRISKDEIDNLILKAIKKMINKEDVNIDLKKLIDNKNEFFRIRKGDIRIIFSYTKNEEIIVSIVENVGFRGEVYK